MKCPHCNMDILGIACQKCNNTIPEESRYCLYCGEPVLNEDSEKGDDFVETERADSIDFDDRVTCSDGNCIGIIENGVCNVCGKPYQGN